MKPYTGFEYYTNEELTSKADNASDLAQELSKRLEKALDTLENPQRIYSEPIDLLACGDGVCGDVN